MDGLPLHKKFRNIIYGGSEELAGGYGKAIQYNRSLLFSRFKHLRLRRIFLTKFEAIGTHKIKNENKVQRIIPTISLTKCKYWVGGMGFGDNLALVGSLCNLMGSYPYNQWAKLDNIWYPSIVQSGCNGTVGSKTGETGTISTVVGIT